MFPLSFPKRNELPFRPHVNAVFDQRRRGHDAFPQIIARQHLKTIARLVIAGVPRQEAVRKARLVLGAMDLEARANALPSQLSGGQQQRVAIARALVHEPRLLVCDEPTAALDANSGRNVMELLRRVAVEPDRAVIVVTHDSRVFDFGDRIVYMSDGRVERIEEQGRG